MRRLPNSELVWLVNIVRKYQDRRLLFLHAATFTQEFQSRVIESLIMLFPIPPIYMEATPNDNEWIVYDGNQRLHAITRFVTDDSFKLTGLTVLSNLNGLSYKELKAHDVQRLSRVVFNCHFALNIDGRINQDYYSRLQYKNSDFLTISQLKHAG